MSDELIALGTAGSGAVAHVDAGGAVRRGDGVALRWWVVAEDRLHRPEQEPAVRQRLVDHAPVVTTAVRVPGGDIEATAFAAVPAGGGPPVPVLDIRNATALPVVIALMADDASGWSLGRRTAGAVSVADPDEAAAVLARLDDPSPGSGGPGRLAWTPLPHTQTLRVAWSPDVEPSSLPDPGQVAAGWARQVERGAAVDLDDPALMARWEEDRRRLVLADDPPGSVGLAERVGALVRLGWFDDAVGATEALVARRRNDGSFGRGDDDPLVATAAAVAGLATWARAGLPADRLSELTASVGGAAAWLTARRRRRGLTRVAAEAKAALEAAAALFDAAHQPRAGEAARRDAARLGPVAAPGGPSTPANRVSELVDGLVVDVPGAISVLGSAGLVSPGRPVEVHGVPTAAGRCSVALRWHGDRPALLWEVEPWPDDTGGEPSLVASALDPRWRGRGRRGEALLAPAPGGS